MEYFIELIGQVEIKEEKRKSEEHREAELE